jgi:uncharacterized protein (TIGR02145 family)
MRSFVAFSRQLLLSLSIFLLFTLCKKESPNLIKEDDPIISEIVNEQNRRLEKVVSTEATVAFLHGIVLDQSGNPLGGVEVQTGDSTQITDSEGNFVFGSITLNKQYCVVRAKKAGYFRGVRTFSPTSGAINKVEIRLQSKGAAQKIDAERGGDLIFESGKVKLSFPAGSIADAEGKPYSGELNVYARYIDPESEGFSSYMPGNLVGLTDQNEFTGMISYGMANVEMRDNNGNILQVAGGKKVKVTMPAIKDAPADMPVWHFNEKYGLWVEAGRATKIDDTYSFDANHFSTWNLDVFVNNPIPMVSFTLKSPNNQAIGNQKIDVYTSDFTNRLARVYTDNNGQFNLLQSPRNLGVRVVLDCQNIDITLDIDNENEILILNNLPGGANVYEIAGIVKDCAGNYANSYFTLIGLTERKISFNGRSDANGAFTAAIIICNIDSSTIFPLRATVITANNTLKIDTIDIRFTSLNVQKNIGFCESAEVENPYLNPTLNYGTVTDIDGNIYATIQIGTQTWMAQNLNVSRFNDGTPIPLVEDDEIWQNLSTGAYCYYDNLPSNGAIYGKLYNGYAAAESRRLCPEGWKIPSDSEWSILSNYLASNVGGQLKSIGNLSDGTGLWASPNTSATNESGFSGLPGGVRIKDGLNRSFGLIGAEGHWWSATAYIGPTISYNRYIKYDDNKLVRSTANRNKGLSCRCVKL